MMLNACRKTDLLLKAIAASMWALLESAAAGAIDAHELHVRRSTLFLRAEMYGCAWQLPHALDEALSVRQREREQWAQEWATRGGGVNGLVAA